MKTKSETAIGGYSPVSYFEAHRPELGLAEFSADHNGNHYLFTSAAQVATFRANPDKYAPAFGGTCAIGHAIGKDFPVDPTSFKIVDGQLLLFLKSGDVDAKALWEKDGDGACMVMAKKHFAEAKHG